MIPFSFPFSPPLGPATILPAVRLGELLVHQVVSPYYAQNGFLLLDPRLRSAVAIDPGFGAAASMTDFLRAGQLTLEYIILTHEHIDHIANLNELRETHRCPVIASSLCSEHITQGKKNLSVFQLGCAYETAPADILHQAQRSQHLWAGHGVSIHSSPGHTDASVCIQVADGIFTGDTLIWDEKTVVKLPTGSRAKLEKTFAWLFSEFAPPTLVFGGHGRAFRLEETNPSVHLK
jgi:glyoxylase-like metal-dependent hydrolase (beta-lactamase superfamily II)